jgi:glycosyltransferase involved in cell wall biosynthesis
MARFYQMSDAYVAPYLAEGFNMPVLEAIACGLPVICTGGGATDDFTRDDFAMRIGSQAKTITLAPGVIGKELHPDQDHLIELMRHVIDDPSFTARALKAGPEFVRGHYTWTHVVDQLLGTLFPSHKE